MKILKVLLISLLVFIFVAIIAIIWILKTIDVNAYRGQITQEISRQIGREVRIGKIGFQFSFVKGVVLDVEDLTIADDSQLKSVNVKAIHLDVNILNLILKRQITIASARLQNGNLIFADPSFDPELTIPVTQIEFETHNASLDKPFIFSSSLALWNEHSNIFARGRVQIDQKQSQVRIEDLNI